MDPAFIYLPSKKILLPIYVLGLIDNSTLIFFLVRPAAGLLTIDVIGLSRVAGLLSQPVR
jgi:hypothetical protein